MILVAIVVLFATLGGTANAATVYDGTMNTTYITYFRDILADLDMGQDYVAYRAGQNVYEMVVGDIEYENNAFTGQGTLYRISTNTGTNNSYTYSVDYEYEVSLDVGNKMVYSSIGDFPQLITIGDKYDFLQTCCLWIALLCMLIRPIFRRN